MTIQIQEINDRSRSIEMSVLFLAAGGAGVALAFGLMSIAFAVGACYIPLSIGVQKWLSKWRETRTLKLYRFVCQPLFEIQADENDRYVHARCEEHKRLLTASGNALFAANLITVEPIYHRDTRFKYAATIEANEANRDAWIEEFINNWAADLEAKNPKLVKQYLYNQDLTAPIASTQETEAEGDFWTEQFPFFSSLLRGKEVKEA